jgi:hypothetical protein
VRREREQSKEIVFSSSVLTAGAKAAVLTAAQTVRAAELEQRLAKTARPQGISLAEGRQLGEFLAENVLAESIRQVLPRMKDRHVVVVHDAPSSRIPWETLRIGDWQPALEGGMSRRYMAENLSVAKYLEQRPKGAKLRVLLVVNPTEDLPGAQAEGRRVQKFFERRPDVELKRLEQSAATRRALLAELGSGRYDLVHYAGHAFFDAQVRARSGLLCAGEEVLTGTDLSALGNLPQLVFFNACESGRLRQRKPGAGTDPIQPAGKLGERVAPAEAFLRGGIANFIGTYWPVGDDAADTFSSTFYTQMLAGSSIGASILAGRKSVAAESSVDWSDYIHYGDPSTRIFPMPDDERGDAQRLEEPADAPGEPRDVARVKEAPTSRRRRGRRKPRALVAR